jgi:hypothetical protein
MKLSITLSALMIVGVVAETTKPAGAVVYCQYVDYPAGCTVRAGVVLRPRPVARAAVTPGVGAAGTPTNRGGPVEQRYTWSANPDFEAAAFAILSDE